MSDVIDGLEMAVEFGINRKCQSTCVKRGPEQRSFFGDNVPGEAQDG